MLTLILVEKYDCNVNVAFRSAKVALPSMGMHEAVGSE